VDRRDHLLKYVSKQDFGIEVGPWMSPIAPKREGYNCLVLDVFDTPSLKKRAAADANIAGWAPLPPQPSTVTRLHPRKGA
jgi:hypothetical protein